MIKLKSWLDAERGRATSLATHLGVSLSRISQISEDGVPPKYMLSVRDFTGGVVSLESMVEARTPQTSLAHHAAPIDPAATKPIAPKAHPVPLEELLAQTEQERRTRERERSEKERRDNERRAKAAAEALQSKDAKPATDI